MTETQLSARRLPLAFETQRICGRSNPVLRRPTLFTEILLWLYERFEGSKSRYGMSSPMKSDYKDSRQFSPDTQNTPQQLTTHRHSRLTRPKVCHNLVHTLCLQIFMSFWTALTKGFPTLPA